MDGQDDRGIGRDGDRETVVRQSLEYLRKRSLQRVWWNSARIALLRGHSGEPPLEPSGHRPGGKRV